MLPVVCFQEMMLLCWTVYIFYWPACSSVGQSDGCDWRTNVLLRVTYPPRRSGAVETGCEINWRSAIALEHAT